MLPIVAIPARLKSTRFPRKVLAEIQGQAMLWHVWHQVSKAQQVGEVLILTDNQEVEDLASSWGANVMMTSEDCPSGTDRIASVAHLLDADIIVNVQADEPLITSAVVDRVIESMNQNDCDVATPVYRIHDIDDVFNPNVVKVVRGQDGQALYFSRSPIPYVRDCQQSDWLSQASFWGHIGVYGYRRSLLLEYSNLPQGKLEQSEKLEQLRLLEAGKQIMAVEMDYHPQAVDTPADLAVVKAILERASHDSMPGQAQGSENAD